MIKKRFTTESERINSTYSIRILKEREVIFEVSNWNSLSTMHKKECEDIADLLNELNNENEQLKQDCTTLIYHNQEYRKENEQLKEELADANELKKIYVDFLVDKGFELSDVVEWSRS